VYIYGTYDCVRCLRWCVCRLRKIACDKEGVAQEESATADASACSPRKSTNRLLISPPPTIHTHIMLIYVNEIGMHGHFSYTIYCHSYDAQTLSLFYNVILSILFRTPPRAVFPKCCECQWSVSSCNFKPWMSLSPIPRRPQQPLQ
jgi:hypothetical protein